MKIGKGLKKICEEEGMKLVMGRNGGTRRTKGGRKDYALKKGERRQRRRRKGRGGWAMKGKNKWWGEFEKWRESETAENQIRETNLSLKKGKIKMC